MADNRDNRDDPHDRDYWKCVPTYVLLREWRLHPSIEKGHALYEALQTELCKSIAREDEDY